MATEEEVKLLGTLTSPFVRRVEWALKLKGIEYEFVKEMDGTLQNKSSLLLESNPVYKKVPVLIHGGKPICDSLNIIEYIDETWPQNPLFPEDPYEKALVRFWAKFAEEKVAEVLRKILTTQGEEQVKLVQQCVEALAIIEGEAKVKKGKFFGGDTVGYLDLALGLTVYWLELIEQASCAEKFFIPHNFPSLCKWMEELKDLSLMKENLRLMDISFQYLENIRKRVLRLNVKN